MQHLRYNYVHKGIGGSVAGNPHPEKFHKFHIDELLSVCYNSGLQVRMTVKRLGVKNHLRMTIGNRPIAAGRPYFHVSTWLLELAKAN